MRQHPILGLKVVSGVSDELRVARMIDGLDAGNDLHQSRVVLADVLDQLGLGIGRSGDENRAGVGDRLSDRLQEGVIFRRMSAADGIGLVMDVSCRVVRMQHQFFDVGRAEMKYARFLMVDPNDGVEMMLTHIAAPGFYGVVRALCPAL